MPSNFYENGLVSVLSDPGSRASLVEIIEGRHDIDDRFVNIKRIGTLGGHGYFSLLFSATDTSTGKRVALKVLDPECRDTYRIDSFEREEKILQTLSGEPDIIEWVAPRSHFAEMLTHPTLSISLPLNFQYFAVELAKESLDAVLAEGRWGPEPRLVAFRAMCRAIQRLHKRHIAHRDLKPDNFLITQGKEIKVSDFGTARRLDGTDDALLAHYAAPPGDLRYTAPEMLAGLHNEEPRIALHADIFSLGAILFELFAGTQLTLHIYDGAFEEDLIRMMGAVRSGRRVETYNHFVADLAAARPLPSVAATGEPVPSCIRERLDALYQAMSALDYRERLRSFESIFRQINICLIILRHERQYRRWLEAKRQRRAAKGGQI